MVRCDSSGSGAPYGEGVAAMDATTEATTGATTTEATTSSAAAEAGALPALGEAEKARLRTAAPLLTSLHCNRSAVLLRLGRTHEARRAAADAVVLSWRRQSTPPPCCSPDCNGRAQARMRRPACRLEAYAKEL